MTIFQTGYDTTMGRVNGNIDHIEHSIMKHIAFSGAGLDSYRLDVTTAGQVKPVFVTGVFSSEMDVPLFHHPILINKGSHTGSCLVTDLRLFINSRGQDETALTHINDFVKNKTEYNLAKSRAILNNLWVNGSTGDIRNNLKFGMTMFGAWLSEVISKAYALDYGDQTTLNIIGCYYYATLFEEGDTLDEDTKERLAPSVIKSCRATATTVFEIFDRMNGVSNIDGLCKKISTILVNVRLKDFNLPALLNVIKNTWYGTNSKEMISVAIEHPPTWCAIVYAALSDKTFKSSVVYKIGERVGKQGLADEYMLNYRTLISQNTSSTSMENIGLDVSVEEQLNHMAWEKAFSKALGLK